jgi:hypothetical protein
LTNVRIAILKDDYPEAKLSEKEQDLIPAEIAGAFRTTPKERLPRLRSYRLEGGALIYVCTDQQSGQWLTEAVNGHRFREGTLLKAMDARDLPRPVKMAIRTWDKQSDDTEELLRWIRDLNPGLHMEHWRVLERQLESKGQRLILPVDRDSAKAIKETGYRVFTGQTEGTFKVLSDPENTRQGKPIPADPGSTDAGVEGRTIRDTPSEIPLSMGASEAVGIVIPTESEAMDESVEGDTPPMAEDVRKEGWHQTLLRSDEAGGKKSFTMKFVQINLHHRKAATAYCTKNVL